MEEGFAEWGGHRTWYGVEGEISSTTRAPLLTLHGGPGATHDYLLSMTDLARDGRAVIFYDQIGNGRSSHYPGRGADFYTVELFVRELASLVDHLGIGSRYHLLGQSWGGMLAQEMVLAHPGGIASVVLSNTAASFGDFALAANALRAELPPEVDDVLRRHEEEGTTDDPEYEEAVEVFYSRHLCRLPELPAEVKYSFDAIEEDPTVYHTTNGPSEFHVIGSFKDWSAKDRLGRWPAGLATLVVGGRHDEAVPALQTDLQSRIDGAELVIFEDSSHMPFWEEREGYMGVVGGWLRRHD